MRPVSLDAALLQKLVPSLVLRPEAIMAARIVEREGGRGTLALMGQLIEAALPDDLEPGTHVRLQVQEATSERVVLRVVDQPQVAIASPVTIPLPNGDTARIAVEERDGGEGRGGVPSIAVSFESATLGRLDFDLSLPPGAVTATVRAALGDPFDRADANAEQLLAALESATGLPARVTVTPRRDPFDAYV